MSAFDAEADSKLVPAAILSEVAYFVERDLNTEIAAAFLIDLDEGLFTLECGEEDLSRIAELAVRYDDLPLGVADAAVIACAERRGGRVLTLDRRHFDIVGREIGLELLP